MISLVNTELGSEVIDWPVYMRRALDLAANVITTSPNPRVGCVVVKDGSIIGEGWHAAPGHAHAEVVALKAAGDNAEAAIVFVSLEPCSHTGRTGPCSEALIQAGVKRVVIAGIDPNPSVSGAGIKRLESAGIKVVHLIDFEAAARLINPGYFRRHETGLPYVRCKLATSLDGRTALASGASKWITGIEARADVQRLRASSSAIITGINTVLADDPSLNVRSSELDFDEEELERNKLVLENQPLRVILDSKMQTPGTARILTVGGPVRIYTVVKVNPEKNPASNVEIIQAQQSTERVSLQYMLESLASDCACNEVLVEAGPTLSTAFIKSGLVDELIIYIAPKLLGSDAKPLLEIAGIQSMSETTDFDIKDLAKVGNDIKVTLVPKRSVDE